MPGQGGQLLIMTKNGDSNFPKNRSGYVAPKCTQFMVAIFWVTRTVFGAVSFRQVQRGLVLQAIKQ
jgi:hypothetical protein